jgi:hypothetical protein
MTMSKSSSLLAVIWSDLKAISGKVALAAWAITLPTLTFDVLVEKQFGDYKTVFDAIVLTWPLTISATFIFMLIMRGWLQEATKTDMAIAIGLLVIVPYLLALALGAVPSIDRRLAWSGGSWLVFLHPFHFLKLIGDILLYYVSLEDGLLRTFKSLVCGLLLAWTYEKVLLPRARSLRDAKVGAGNVSPG